MFYINSEFVSQDLAKISVLDLAILRGFGAFEYLRTYNQKPFHLTDHLLRFQYSAEQMGLKLPKSFEEIEEIIFTLLKQNLDSESSIKLILTGGISEDQFQLPHSANLIIFTYPICNYSSSDYLEGIKVATTSLSRSLPTVKSTQYTSAIIAMNQAKAFKPKEILYLNGQHQILEGTTSNFFAIKDNTLFTCCSEEVLFGITREVVLQLMKSKISIADRPISYQDIDTIQEAFLTSSTREIMPVTQIDGHPIHLGKVGPITQQILHLFKEYTSLNQWPFLNISRYSQNRLLSTA